jgi:zinc finger protein
MSFECSHCGFKNSEIQPASEIQIKGVKYVLQVTSKEDMNRQVVKSDSCVCKFAELDVEIPAKRGHLTTVEGLLQQIYDDLSPDQEKRKEIDMDTYNKIEEFLARVKDAIDGKILPLTLTCDDPAGNSWVQFVPGEPGHKWSRVEYFRSKEQSRSLGLNVPADDRQSEADRPQGTTSIDDDDDIENLHNEVQRFHTQCPSCHRDSYAQMKVVNIPHFKDVIIMATSCEYCGYKSNEVKTGGAIPEKGRRIALRVTEKDDLARDILKSETCGLTIPELELNLVPGTLGGRFTTIEGLLSQVHDELHSRVFTETSDSMDKETLERWEKFLGRLKTAIEGDTVFHVIMEDPLAASYIQNVYAPDEDPNMVIEDFERTEQQNEDLGITDMRVD